MRIACIGGGPAGLFFAILMKSRQPGTEVVVHERNRRGDTFGFGVVFSDETLANIAVHDPESIRAIEREFRHWSAMDVRVRGRRLTSDGHGFAALARVRLLDILARRAIDLGVDVRFEREVDDIDAVVQRSDLVIWADGVNSLTRTRFAAELVPSITDGAARFIWTGTDAPFDRFTFIFTETPHGWVQAHVYPFDDRRSTFIVEMAESTWREAGLAGQDDGLVPGESDAHALKWCESVFAEHLGGCGLIGNNSKWLNFPRVQVARWSHGNVVLLGDSAHTAHFSVGSGTKLALEDAIALADAVCAADDVPKALSRYEAQRRPVVESLQRAAATSEEWFQQVDRHIKRPVEQFVFSLFTRSQRVTHDNLAERDQAYVAATREWFHSSRPPQHRPADPETPPIFYPFTIGDLTLGNRIVVSPMAQYCAVAGVPTDWHLVHLGSRAVGGAGLVMTEMTCTAPDARITPGCTGIWSQAQTRSWARITAFVHEHSESAIGLQIGHAGRKGSTKVMWEEMDAPLDRGNWPLVSASPLPYRHDSQVPHEMTPAQMDVVTADFVAAARRGLAAGFDLLEIHAAHGYLLSSFLSPVTNRRTDAFGGDLAARARFPLRVIRAVREAWPAPKPLSVRISATDWVPGGFSIDDAVALGGMLSDAGVDVIDVSSGQVDPAEQIAYGRLYQTPFSEVIRNTVGIPTMAVGAISSIDDVNTVLMAGRADLCLIARAHLIDPYWTLNAAIDLAQPDQPWPRQYLPGRTSRRREQSATALIGRDLR
ncbi:MAG TPA: bifunctional salicylyl-CoA 5-hydroxylase/oxidoreductase [Euzebya sp.]|nr:bifunctional salicylyl-CoA 5-hydroxylase/oxidoreductase [Euzebya sp.]